MRVFVSWSGKRGKALAQSLVNWLPRVLPLVKPWMSEEIPTGSLWRSTLLTELEKAHAGIVCLTPENLRSQWLNFEAGAATAITAPEFRVYPVFLGSETVPGPLEGLQVSTCSEEGIRHLVHTLNSCCESCGEPKFEDAWVDAQVTLLWKDLAENLKKTKGILPDVSWHDYDDAIKNIQEHLNELQHKNKVNVITFYVRDYAAPEKAIDFYIEATNGLWEPEPMYGPVVSKDFRKEKIEERGRFIENQEEEMKKAMADKIAGRAKLFIGREKIIASATFCRLDSDSEVKALLNLNWRKEWPFPDERKRQLREDAAAVFGLLPARPSISLKRSRLVTKELRARRYLGAGDREGASAGDQRAKIRGALAEFFAPDDEGIQIEIISLDTNRAMKWPQQDGKGKTCSVETDWKWVQATTKPLFLKKTASDPAAIIVPMRIPPKLEKCRGIIMISESANRLDTLNPDMVRPLCSLGDTFGGMVKALE